MSIFDTFLAKRQTLTDFCDHRKMMVRLVTEHFAHADLLKAKMQTFYEYGLPRSAEPYGRLDDAIKDMDRMYWRKSFNHTGLMQLLDARSKETFDRELNANPPAFNLKNVQASFLELSQKADVMFEDGVVNVFKRLSGNYHTNDAFRIGDRIVMTNMIEPRWKRGLQLRYGMAEDEINDVDRVYKHLDAKRHEARALSNAMNNTLQNTNRYEDEYFEAKAYKNGNLHLRFKRTDLTEQVNRIIAKRFGAAIGTRGKTK